MSGSGLALSLPLRAEHTAELCKWIAPAKPVDLITDPEQVSCRGFPGLLKPLLRQAHGGGGHLTHQLVLLRWCTLFRTRACVLFPEIWECPEILYRRAHRAEGAPPFCPWFGRLVSASACLRLGLCGAPGNAIQAGSQGRGRRRLRLVLLAWCVDVGSVLLGWCVEVHALRQRAQGAMRIPIAGPAHVSPGVSGVGFPHGSKHLAMSGAIFLRAGQASM